MLFDQLTLEHVTLNITQIPSHTHAATGTVKANFSPLAPSTTGNPTNNNFSNAAANMYNNSPADIKMAANNVEVTVGNVGGSQSHENRQPFLACYYIICLQGVFPSRN